MSAPEGPLAGLSRRTPLDVMVTLGPLYMEGMIQGMDLAPDLEMP